MSLYSSTGVYYQVKASSIFVRIPGAQNKPKCTKKNDLFFRRYVHFLDGRVTKRLDISKVTKSIEMSDPVVTLQSPNSPQRGPKSRFFREASQNN